MRDKKRKSAAPGSEPPPAETGELPERWSAQRKTELVLRLLRVETLDTVSRESQVPAHELESWSGFSWSKAPAACASVASPKNAS